ncbi:MAG: hypothetical protein H7Y88_08260 [Phycisphaerales bacterium]|nr:hypothetical protein [Phycisphaerales bacterium]
MAQACCCFIETPVAFGVEARSTALMSSNGLVKDQTVLERTAVLAW